MKLLSLLCLSLCFCSHAFAAWVLDENQSSLYFMSTKKDNVTEIHWFTEFSGNINDDGELSIQIPLASFETGIEIRNQRMKEKLFNVALFPVATLNASDIPCMNTKVNAEFGITTKVGATKYSEVIAELNLHGETKTLVLDVRCTLVDEITLIANSTKPILIKAADYKLDGGIEILRDLAGLPNISTTVPVTFNLIFKRQD